MKLFYLAVLYTLLSVVYAYKETKTSDVRVRLDATNFDEEVMRSKDIWFIEYMTKDCHHCVKLEPKFKKAAWVMKDRVKFGYVDLDDPQAQVLARRFKIDGIPTIVIFDYGYKNKRKSKMIEYQGEREWKNLVTYAQNMF